MRRRLASAITLFAAIVFVQTAPLAYPQNEGPESLLVETSDGVKLNALFYKSPSSKNGSCVVLMHQLQIDPNKGDWDGLAKRLTKEGYHVLRFDFRGHGKSTDLIPEKFWKSPGNLMLPGANKNPPKKELVMKDFERKNAYTPYLVNDLAAVRNALDKLNDDGQVNVSSTYLIGAGDAAPLGLLFLTAEWHREQVREAGALNLKINSVGANNRIRQGSTPAGRDYGGCVWLSPSKHPGIPPAALQNWVSNVGRDGDGDMRKETPMLLIHGEKDKDGERDAAFYRDQVLVAKGKGRVEKLEFFFERKIPGTELKGVDLLGKGDATGTEKMIVDFLGKMEEYRRKKTRVKRDYNEPLPIIVQSFGVGN